MSGVSLTGKNRINQNNLSGKSFFGENASFEVKKIKTTIFNNIILPLISKQWRKLEENLFTLDKINKKLDMYLRQGNSEDLLIYKDILKAFETMLNEHKQLDELEKTMYSSTNDVSTMVYKTTMIRLKPEYEIYDMIFGRPNRKKQEQYNEETIQRIEGLLNVCDITFDTIKEIIMYE
jgi:hypothetical protein